MSSSSSKKNGDPPRDGDEEKRKEEEASTALMKILTLSRDTPLETLQEMVQQVLQSHKYAPFLPVVICYLRNHKKSLAPGSGSGERDLAERLTLALWSVDNEAGVMMLRFLVAYGSWKSMLNLLVLLDDLVNADEEGEDVLSESPAVMKRGVPPAPRRGRRVSSGGPPRRSAANEGPYQDLADAIHKLFAKQLKDDQAAVDQVENAPGEIPVVSNAAKFAPHEGRGRHLTSAHADAIASKLFSGDEDGTKNKYAKRKRYRHLRSRLNEANQHLPDRYLAMNRADELQVHQITAGYLSKSRKALLNIPVDSEERKGKKMRYNNAARIDLRERVLKAAVDPKRIPAPSDVAELAQGLLDVAAEEIADAGERTLLESTYLKAVMELAKKVKDRQQEVTGLLRALSVDPAFDVSKTPSDVVVAVDVSPSQSCMFPTAALLVLLFNDTIDALAEDQGLAEDEDEKPAARRCIIFHQSAETLALPISRLAPTYERLASLVKSFRSSQLTVNGKDGNDYNELMARLKEEIAGRPEVAVVVCSDFSSSPKFAAAVEQSFEGPSEISCWRMNSPSCQRLREISWDPNKPQIDLCIVLDTTGSMGSYIAHCNEQIRKLLRTLGETAGMPVACSFVSYKDFGNAGHLQTHPWVSAAMPRQVAGLRDFVNGLQASGGDDAEEDIAGAFEKAADLMEERRVPSLKLILLIADAGAHGYPSGRPRHGGVDQQERLKKAVLKLASKRRLGCELMLAQITSHTDLTCEAIDSWLQEERTFIDQIQMGHVSGTVFRDKILDRLQEVVAHAIAPATAKGLDVYSGSNFGVCASLLNTRLINYAFKLNDALDEDEKTEEVTKQSDMEGSGDEAATETLVETNPRDKLPTAFQNLLSKLMADDYNMVREAMGVLQSGVFARYEAPPDQTLSKESVDALLQVGLTVQDLVDGGYPAHIVNVFKQELKDRLSRPSK